MNPLAFISPRGWTWIGGLLLCIAVWAGLVAGKHAYDDNRRAEGAAVVRAQWDAAVRTGQAILDAKEQTRRVAQEKADVEHSQALAAAAADAAAAAGAADRLRVRVDALVAAARRQAAPGGSAAGSGPGVEGGDPIGVLADMQRRIDEAAGRIGGYADQLRVAGQLCERTHDALSANQLSPLVPSSGSASPGAP